MIPRFRAWHKENKRLCFVYDLNWPDYERAPIAMLRDCFDNRFDAEMYEIELMQWTGLQDKNGKDIYEGDIVFLIWPDGNVPAVVEYNSNSGIWSFKHLLNKDWSFFEDKEECRIIGNIYENPELLKGK